MKWDGGDVFGVAILVALVLLVLAGMVKVAVEAIQRTINNARQPEISGRARLIFKRSVKQESDDGPVRTVGYIATFEMLEDGERREFTVSADEYGKLTVGDVGMLRSQGTWFTGFHIYAPADGGTVKR